MALETTTYGPKDKKPKWQVTPFNFSKVKKTGDTANVKREPKVTQPVVRQDNGKAQDEPIQQTTDQPVLGMGDLKQAESEGTVNFFDQKPPKNLNDLYQMPQDATKAPVYDYNKLKDLPITKKVYKDRQNDPENREPTYPISQPVETPPGSYEAADIQPQLQEEEIKQKAEIVNKINSGEINLPPFVSSLPVDMQLGYVGATYNNNPLYTSLTTLMEPLLHLDNLVRSGMNKAFSTDYKMLTPPNMSGEDEDDRMITAGTEILTSLIPLGASIKGANYLLKGVKNPFVRNMLGTGLGFVINSQPALLDNLQQGHMELKDYAIQTAKDLGTGLSFGILPKGLPLKYEIPYQTIVPTMVPVIADLIQGKPVNEKEIIDGIVSNAVLSLVMSGKLPRETKVKEVARQVQTELNKYDESQQTPEVLNRIMQGLLLPPKSETNSETISRIKPGEVKTETITPSRIGKLFGQKDKTVETRTNPTIEQVTIPGDRSRIVVDENGKARLIEEKDAQDLLLSKSDVELQKEYGMTPEEIQRAKQNLNNPAYPQEPVQPEARQDTGTKTDQPKGVKISADPKAQIELKTEEARVNKDFKDKNGKEVIPEITNPVLVNSQSEPIKNRVEYLNEAIREHNKQFDPPTETPAPKRDGRLDQLETVNERIKELQEESKTANKNEQRKISERIERLQEQRDLLDSAIKQDSRTENKQDNSIKPKENNSLISEPEKPTEPPPVKKEPEREYKTVKLDAEDIGSKWVEDEKGNKFVVKKETDPTSGRDKYVIYKKTSADTEPQKAGDYYSEYSVNLGLRSHAEGDMYLKNRPAEKIEQQKPADERTAQEKKAEDAYSDMLSLRDEVNNVKSGDLSGRANKSNNVRLLKKTVDTYNANHPDNKAKIERTKYGTYNITINGKPLRRESVKREFNVEDKAGEIDNPNANKPYKELGAEEREVQRKVAQNILDADPSVVKNKAGFETPMKVFRKGLQDIKDDSGKEQSPEAQIVRQEMLEKTDNGKEYRQPVPEESLPKQKNLFEKMSLAEIEKHVNDKAKELGSRADYLRSDEYKELIKPVMDKLLSKNIAEVKKQVYAEKEKLKNKIITKEQYDKAIQNIKDRGRNMYTTPIDPAALKDIMVVGLYHFEQGARTLASWSKKMVKELGDKVRPYLKEVYKGINKDNKDRVFHGTKDLGDNTVLKRDVKGNSIIPEGIFVTHSLSYAERYKVNEVDNNHKLIPGKIYETKIKKNNEIFDATKPAHLDKLLDGFKQQLKDGEYDSIENVMSDYNNARRYISESIHKGALDWGVGTEYLEQIEKAGFKGAKLLERPADDITENPDGSYNLKGDPIYSYALFKDTPVKSANTVSKESKDRSLDNINNPKRNKLSHQIPWDSEYNTTLDNMTKNVPNDFYTHPEYYAYFKDRADRESWQVIKNVKGKPDAEVTIYRAAPKGVNEISAGDWVSLSRTYAKDHGKHHEDKSLDMPVISKKVRVDEVIWDNNSINEFAYYPKEVQRIVSSESYKKAVEQIRRLPDKAGALPLDYYAKNIKNLATIGLHHLESGLRTFGDWAKRMVKELGEKIKPHLKKIWAEINDPKNMRKFRENNPEAKMNTSGYAGRQALGYEKAKEEKKVFKNPYDQKERFEIDDSKAELKLNETWKLEGKTFNDVYNQIGITKKAWGDNNTIMLQDILIHPELYKNYPEAKRLIVIPEELKGAKAAYETRSQLIKVDYDLRADEVKSALLHEIQHAIQQAEGFAKGGNVKEFKDVNTKDKLKKELIDVASSLFDKLPEELKSDARKINRDEDTDGSSLKKIQNNKEAKAIWADYLNARKQIEEVSNSSDSGYPIETAYDQYQKLAGEIEARDVQARMDLTADQRDPNSSEYVAPYSSENIAPQDAILKYDGTESHSMKLKEEETFEQYKKRIAKQYGTVPTREEYNDAKQLQVTSDKVQPKKDESNVKAELEEVLKDVVAPTKGRTLDEMRSRTSKKKMNATANESYMGKVYSTISETIKEYEKKGLRDQSLLSRADIESTKKIYNDPEFKKFRADQKKAIVSMVKRYFKEEYKKQNLPDKNSYSYPGDGWYKGIKKHGFLQSLNVIRNMGKAGKEFAERMNIAKDDERMWHGKADALMFDMASLSKAEMNNLEAIWKAKMHENIPPMHLNDNVKNMDVKLDKYFDDIAIEMKDRAVMTKNKLTGDVYLFKPRKDYRPRVMKNDKALEKLAIEYDKNGNALRNEERARAIDHLVITGQAKDGARAAELLDGVIAENRIRKAGNVEYSRSITFPEEYYTSNPVESLHKYASAVSKRIAFIDAWGKDGSVAHQLIDQIGKDHQDYEFAKKLFKYETDQLTPSERKKLEIVNSVKGYMALTKFTPFTTLRNTFQGFLGATTRGNLKSGFVGLAKTLSPTMRRYVYESGAVADNIESLIKDIAGGEANNKIGKLTSFYLDKIGFTMTDRVNRLVSGAAGLSFYQDMLKRIKNDSVLKRRAYREFEKLGIDPEAILKRDQPEFTDAEKKLFIRNFAYDSQFSLKPQDLPLFWSSGTGKLLTQWKPWSYKMTQLIRDNVIGEIKQGNAMPLITMMAAYGLAGETASFIIDSIRSPFKYNDRKDEDENLSPIEKTSVGYLSRGEIDGFLDRLVQDLGSLGALSAYYDFARAIGYGKSLRGIGAYVGPAPGELITSIVDLATPISTRFFGGELFRSDAEDFKKMTTDTFKGIYNASGRNLPFAGTPRTLGLTRKGYDWLFKNDGPDFKDDSIIGEYYKQLDDPGKEEVKKIKQMEKDLKDFKEKVLAGPTKELQREFARKESEIKRYKDKSKVWYNYTKLKSSKEKEESTKLGK